jgi:hypothetical protein
MVREFPAGPLQQRESPVVYASRRKGSFFCLVPILHFFRRPAALTTQLEQLQ